MKQIYFLSFLFLGLLVYVPVFGQCDQDIILSSQEEVDNFMVDYGCTEIGGSLTIEGDDIVDLSGLSGITSIGGYLYIMGNDILTNIDGLNNLTSIGGDISIWANNALTNIDGLGNISLIEGYLEINYNSALMNINGLSNLNSIEGYFEIFQNDALPNLNGISNLTSIGEGFSINSNETLTNINALSSLSSIGGPLYIGGTDLLTNLDGLNNLTSIGEQLHIGLNNALINLDGLSNLNSIGGFLHLNRNDALTNIDGLSNLNFVDGYLWLEDNDALINVNGLSSISSITGDLRIQENDALTNIDGLSNLTSIGEEIDIYKNNALTNIGGLSNLTSIGEQLKIQSNNALTNINGLNSLEYIGEDLLIYTNYSLNSCCIIPYLTSITQGGINIYSNATGCNSLGEIIDLCNESIIVAQPFYDQNENSILDIEEQLLYNLPFTMNPEALYSIYDNEGNFIFFVEPATYTIQYDNISNSLWQVNGTNSHTITTTNEIILDTTFYFAMQPVTDFIIQNVDVTSSITRCNRESNVWLTYTNKSSETTSGYVHLIADELATFVSATPPVDSIAGDTLFWFYEDLYPTHSDQIHLIYEMPGVGEDAENLGAILQFDAQMETWDGEGENKGLLLSELVCAYDPNDKLVTPSGVGEENYTLFEDSLLYYTIRFQNTGNDTAFSVSILDTIQDYLDIGTFQFIASSHDVGTKIDENTKIIEFLFEDIYLPDSNVNEPASHGFVKFSMETDSNLEENTLIENTAHIYFDFNPAIVTNTTANTMISEIPTGLTSIQEKEDILLYPNPNTGTFMVETEGVIKNLKIYNGVGQLIQENEVGTSTATVDVQAIQTGIYFVAVETEMGVVVEKVLVQ